MFKNKTLLCAIAIFLTYTLFFYGPLGLYLSNTDEFWFRLVDVLIIVSIISFCVTLVIILLGFIVPKKLEGIYELMLFCFALGIYFQGTFLKSSFGTGVLDGKEINWIDYKEDIIISLLVWLACIALSVVIYLKTRKNHKLRKKIYFLLSMFFISIQIPAMIIQLLSYHESAQSELTITSDGMLEFAEKENIIIYLMDEMDNQYFNDYMSRNPTFFDNYEGFVNYDNALASGARTLVAVPSMLTGTPYLREETYSDYTKKIWNEQNVLSELNRANYDVRVFSENNFFSSATCKYVKNFYPAKQVVGSYSILAKKLYKLTAYRFSPTLIKQRFWITTEEFEEAKEEANAFPVGSDDKFYNSLLNSGISVNKELDKSFRFYLLRGAHDPYNLISNVQVDKKNATLESQVDASFVILDEFLKQLKECDLYDNSTIIVASDHGDLDKAQQVTFLFKAPNTHNEFTTNHAAVSMFDIPVYIYDYLGNNQLASKQKYGELFTKILSDEVRERHFFRNITGSSRLAVDEYQTYSTASDYEALSLVQAHDYALSKDEPYKFGEELTFGLDATANRYCVEGFDGTTGFRTFTYGPYASMHIPISNIPRSKELLVHIDLGYGDNPINTIIKINGIEVYNACVGNEEFSDGINIEVLKNEIFKTSKEYLDIEFIYPDISGEELELELRDRTAALIFKTLTISEK